MYSKHERISGFLHHVDNEYFVDCFIYYVVIKNTLFKTNGHINCVINDFRSSNFENQL